MIEQFKDYDQVKAYSEFPTLPKGGYVLKIMGVSVKTNSNGKYLQIGCDIAEGEYKDFFTKQYTNDTRDTKKWGCNYLLSLPKDDGTEQDGWTKRSFKTFTEALEDSNNGYHFDWDEQKFKGKLIGGLFNEREYQKTDGTIGRATNLDRVCAAEKIRKGDYKLPEDKLIKRFGNNTSGMDGFVNVPEGTNEELPF
jgi:hypothetical protein